MRTIYDLNFLILLTCIIGTWGILLNSTEAAPRPSPSNLVTSAHVPEPVSNRPGLSNVGRVAPGIFRGAQPEQKGYATLKSMGIRTVIDLRTTTDEKGPVEAAGMKAIALPIEMNDDRLREKVNRVIALMANSALQPVYVHCRHGQDRTGIVIAIYRMKYQGWSTAEADAEMQAFGFNDIWLHYKRFIRRYGAELNRTKSLQEKSP